MTPNSSQLAACRPGEIQPETSSRAEISHSERPYQKTAAVNQAYNDATEWEWILSSNPDAGKLVWIRCTASQIDPLLPEHRLQLDEINDHTPACRTLGGLWMLENMDEGEDFRAPFLRRLIAELAQLPNTLLAKTIIRLYGEEALDVTEHGRIRFRAVDWIVVHGALWPSDYRGWVEQKIRMAELMAVDS